MIDRPEDEHGHLSGCEGADRKAMDARRKIYTMGRRRREERKTKGYS
jgi:hypothetical protein